mgnify:CR=1 FL=1
MTRERRRRTSVVPPDGVGWGASRSVRSCSVSGPWPCFPTSGRARVSLAQANEFVRQHHRHHKPVAGHKFSIGCAENGRLCAVAIVGRPVSRYLDDGFTLEVNRLCSDGTKNACSILYAAAARAARAMGYRKIITYTLDTESGASLRAAGWTNTGLAGGKAWTGSRRPAQPLYPAQMKYRYEKRLNGG